MPNRTTAQRAALALAVAALAVTVAIPAMACDEAQKQQADHAFGIATNFLSKKDWDNAIPQLQTALERCPDHAKALKYLGKAYMATKRYDEAKVQFEALIDAQGRNVTAGDYMDLGKAEAKLKKYPAARRAYMRAYKLDGENCNILFNYGMMNYAVKDYAGAVDVLGQAAEGCPDIRDRVLEKLANACEKAAEKEERLGNMAQAEEYRAKYQEIATEAGGSVGYRLMAQRMKAKDYAGAVAAGQDFLAKNPETDKKDKVYLNMARSQEAMKQYGPSAQSFKNYLKLRPQDGKVAGELVQMLAGAGRCDQALAEAEAARGRMPGDANVRYAQGKALECDGRYMDAKEEFRFVNANASGQLKKNAAVEMGRMDQLEEIRQLKRQNAGR